LGILNEDEPWLSFPGCHSIIYPVELPEWLPPPIVDKLTKQIQAHLRRELDIMVQGAEQKDITGRKKTHAYHLSESGASEASTTSGDVGDGLEFSDFQSAHEHGAQLGF
jgi:hypothetical protein